MKTVILPEKYKYTLKLPYNDDTKQAIKSLRKEFKGILKIRVRGSGPRAKWSRINSNNTTSTMYDQFLPLKYSTYVRLYFDATEVKS